MKKKIFIKLIVVFALALTIVTTYFLLVFTSEKNPVNAAILLRIIKTFSLIISLPATLVFVLIDGWIAKRVSKTLLLQAIRIALLLGVIYLVMLALSGYIIANILFWDLDVYRDLFLF